LNSLSFEPKKRIEKIIISGNVIEYLRYLIPISVEPREHEIHKNEETSKGKRLDNLTRARAEIRRTIWCNQTEYTKFVTLTYAETNLDNDSVQYDFKQFIKKLRRRGYTLPYLYVTEHQKERGVKEGNEGSLHIHALLFTDTFIPASDIDECWGLGRTEIKAIKDINNLGAYVCKYLTKEEITAYHKHSYHLSRGLKKPEILTTDGYIGDYGEMYSNILKYTDFKMTDISSFSFSAPDGRLIENSIIYQQGVFK